jgi:hypothetical protein
VRQWRLGTPYPMVGERVREIVRGASECVVVGATGVGDAVVDLLRQAQLGCEVWAVTITGGEGARSHAWSGGGGWNVPKQVRELLNLQMARKSSGSVRIGADGHGQHDDLAIALALACWRARRGMNLYGVRALPG